MKRSFRTELFVSFLAIALITLIASGSFLISAVKQKMEYDYEKQSLVEISQMKEAMEGFFADTEIVLHSIIADSKITDAINDEDSWHLKKAYSRLFAITEGKRELATYYVFDASGECVLTTAQIETEIKRPTYWGILKVATAHPDDVIVKNDSYSISESDAAIGIAKAVVKEDECIGYIMAEVSADDLDAMLNNLYSSDSEIVVLDEFWEEVYSSESARKDSLVKLLHARRFAGETIKQSEDGFMFFIDEMPERGLFIVLGKQSIFTESLTKTMMLVIISLAALALVLCFFVARILSRFLMSPLEKMTEAMEKVRLGDLTVQMNSTRSDEFGQLSRDFDDMTKALKVYVDMRSKQQQELSDSNIAMMQAQLNPHFLYNTLDTIKWVAKANHVPELATLSSSLAKILRASISADIFVTLADEMELIQNYIEIQKIRFSESFSFDAEVPMELEDAIIPKLILQPMVENAIVHGLKDRDGGHIFLNAYERENRLTVDIEDDGRGMSEGMLTVLNNRDRDKLKGHIGFYNVDTIIRLHYGLNYGLHAENLKDGGVRITMELPLKFGEEGYKDNV